MKPIQVRLEILSVENGWVIFTRGHDFHPGFEVPKYVFTCPQELANAVRNFLRHGEIEVPEFKAPVEEATQLTH